MGESNERRGLNAATRADRWAADQDDQGALDGRRTTNDRSIAN